MALAPERERQSESGEGEGERGREREGGDTEREIVGFPELQSLHFYAKV